MPVVDLSFRVLGGSVPADHGQAVYGAMSRVVPWVHEAAQARLGIHPINGHPAGNRLLHLTASSRLTVRVDSEHIAMLLPLAGSELELDGHSLRVGVPTTYPLRPRATLRSRLVTFKHRMDPNSFLEMARAELTKLGIQAQPGLSRRQGARALEGKSGSGPDRSPFIRRTVRIHDKEVVGYALVVQGLTADESLKLQEHGVGGRRRYGCGIFVPVRE